MPLTNPLLLRQVRKHLPAHLASDPALEPLLQAVAEAYDEAGRNQAFAERTLEVVSAELTEANERLRHESESRLEALSRHYQQTLELQQGMILCFEFRDGAFVHTLCSGQLAARLGWSPDHVVGHRLDDFLTPEIAAVLHTAYTAAWAGQECRTEFSSAGGQITCLASLRPRTEQGAVCEVIVSAVEISDLKQAQAEAQKLALVAARTDNAVVITDAGGRIEWVNEGFSRITGYALAEVAGRSPGSFLQGPESDPTTIAWMRDHIRRGEGFQTEIVNYNRQGTKYWVAIEVQPIRDDHGRVVRYMAIESDVTGRRQADESVRAQFRLSQALAAAPGLTEVAQPLLSAIGREMVLGPGFLWLVSPNALALNCSAAWAPEDAPATGFITASRSHQPVPGQGILGRAWTKGGILWETVAEGGATDPRSRDARNQRLQTVIALPIHSGGSVVGVVEFFSERKESPDNPRLLTLRALSAQIGQFFERIQAEESLRRRSEQLMQANAELARASHLKDAFLASMSHELRTPLNSILGLSESIVDGLHGPLTEKQSRYLNLVVSSGRHLLALINDILELAKIEAGQQELQFSHQRMAELCQAAVQMVSPVAKKRRQTVETEIADVDLVLNVDARRIKQILVNLLGNAVKFTPEGGRVGVRLARVGDEVRLAVWDHGIGIAEADLPRLFTPFVQLDTRLSREYSGTGLGLSLVKQLASLHGGRVEVISQPGQGSTFTVVLPASRVVVPAAPEAGRSAVAPEPPPALPSVAGGGVPHILIAEDQELNVIAVRDYLESKGYRITIAGNGREVIRLAQELRPDLIMMDVQMPVMDGIEATRTLRALPDRQLANLPIIAVTALAMVHDRELCLAAGVNDYLAKPYSLRELHTLIARLLVQSAGR